MQWINPMGGFAFLALPVILSLYLLKRKYEDTKVSSTLLWRRALGDPSASRPLQRLRKNLLMILQLFLALFLALAIMRPASVGKGAGDTVFIFDVSASMGADANGVSRLERAIRDARGQISGAVTVLTAGRETRSLVTRSTNPAEIERALSGIVPETGGAKINQALSVARAMAGETPSLRTIVYSDEPLPAGASAALRAPFEGAANRGVLSLAVKDGRALSRLTNYGPACDLTLRFLADGALLDIQTISLPEGGDGALTFDVPEGSERVRVEIIEKDALSGDDAYEIAVPKAMRYRAALSGTGNIFLAKALALREDLTVSRGTASEIAASPLFDLYIFDGEQPQKLPETGTLWLLAPKAAEKKHATLKAGSGDLAQRLTKNLPLWEVAVSAYRKQTRGEPILLAGDDPVVTLAAENGRKILRFGFDLHDSNLPLKPDFPILIGNLLAELLPEQARENPQSGLIDSGERDVREVPQSSETEKSTEANAGAREWTGLWILFALLLLVAEWWVNLRGY